MTLVCTFLLRVDYVDSLGRSRRCLKRDLGQLQKMDKDITPSRRSVSVTVVCIKLGWPAANLPFLSPAACISSVPRIVFDTLFLPCSDSNVQQ